MTNRYNAQNAARLHRLGIEFCRSYIGCSLHGHRIYLPNSTEVQIHTQNTMGESFTLWVSTRENFAHNLISTSHIFVNYGDTGTVSAHYLEKPTHETYEMSLVRGGNIALVFRSDKCTEMISIDDHDIWNEFRKYSSARKFNLNSPHYVAA